MVVNIKLNITQMENIPIVLTPIKHVIFEYLMSIMVQKTKRRKAKICLQNQRRK